CPVEVRDVLHKDNNEAEFVYFITPSPLNINGITRVPKQREDGLMEIQLWKFNSAHEFKDDSLCMNMKFKSHEGNMSGLIICGLEFRLVLEVKEDYEEWEPKLPKDYKEIILIIQVSKCPELEAKMKEELYSTFSKGILLQQDKVLLSFDGDGDRNELVSATMFTYVNSCAHKWRSLIESSYLICTGVGTIGCAIDSNAMRMVCGSSGDIGYFQYDH
ncbi:hypothetical protein Tco_1012761, partial [Tanacetum coccineum]